MSTNRMMIMLLIGAILTGAGGWFLANNYIKGSVDTYKAQFDDGREVVRVVVASKDLGKGDTVSPETVSLREMPKAYVHADALTGESFAQFQGRELEFPVSYGSAVLPAHLAKPRESSFSTLLEPGTRALTLPVDTLDSVSGFLRPGDHIDIFFTVNDSQGERTVPLLQNVKVLAAGRNIGNNAAEGRNFREITMGVAPEDAARLIHAQQVGSLKILLRSAGDETVANAEPVTLDNLLGESPKPLPRPVVLKGFEVIRGGR